MSDEPVVAPAPAEILPTLPEEITPEWLGAKLGHKIKTLEHTHSIWGTESKLFYTITYEEELKEGDKERPTHVCIKGIFDAKLAKEQPWTIPLAQREAEFFSKIAPKIEGLMLFPRGWWSGTSENQGIAVMSDLNKEGCTFPGEVANYSIEKLKDSVEQLAGLHAKYWGQSESVEPWIWNNYDPAMTFLCSPWQERVRTAGRPKLPDHLMDGERCLRALQVYFKERNPRFRTLLHGDTHIGNVYFSERDHDGRIGFLDWSAFHFGSCFHDIVYHMTALLTIEDRRAHEMEILDHYLESLHRLGGPKFDRHNDPEVMIEYRRSFMTNVIWLICPYELQTKERVDELCARTVATYVDHQVIDVILNPPNKPRKEEEKELETKVEQTVEVAAG